MRESTALNDELMLEVFNRAIETETLGIMSHLSRGKWHMTKIVLRSVNGSSLKIEIAPKDRPLPINIQLDQPVGLTFKYDYNKYLCETNVIGFEKSITENFGGMIVLDMPDKIDKMQKRSYFRVNVPRQLKVSALLWHRGYSNDSSEIPHKNQWKGSLVDVSAGGMQIAVSLDDAKNFKVGQVIGTQFVPLPNEKPLLIEGQIRHIAKTADEKFVCVGLQTIGLEASVDGRKTLKRLGDIVEEYYKISKSGTVKPENSNLQ